MRSAFASLSDMRNQIIVSALIIVAILFWQIGQPGLFGMCVLFALGMSWFLWIFSSTEKNPFFRDSDGYDRDDLTDIDDDDGVDPDDDPGYEPGLDPDDELSEQPPVR